MNKIFAIWCLLLLAGSSVLAQGILFEQGTWKEALAKAKQENKILFVDVYTSWCGPCKIVAKTVFPQEKVGDYYNHYFISYQLDGEKGDGPDVVKKYGVNTYPTFLYLNGDGELVYRFSGAKDVKGFLEEAGKVTTCAKFGGWEKMQADYKAGSQNPDFLQAYYDLSDRGKKPEVLNRYLMALPDEKLFTVEVGKMFERDITLYDYALLKRMIEGRVKLGEQTEDFDFYFTFGLQRLLTNYLDNAIDTGNEKLFQEALQLRKIYHQFPRSQDPDVNMVWGRGAFFASEDFLHLRYLRVNGNDDGLFQKSLESYMEKLIRENPLDTLAAARVGMENSMKEHPRLSSLWRGNLERKHQLIASYLIDFTDYYWRLMPSDKTTRERCAAWANYACTMNPYNPETPVKAAGLLVRLKHKQDAVGYLEQAIQNHKILYGDAEKLSSNTSRENAKSLQILEKKLRDVKNGKE